MNEDDCDAVTRPPAVWAYGAEDDPVGRSDGMVMQLTVHIIVTLGGNKPVENARTLQGLIKKMVVPGLYHPEGLIF